MAAFKIKQTKSMIIQEHSIDVLGGQLFVRQWQIKNSVAAPIILLHDSLGSVEQWRTFPQALAQQTKRNVIAYDRLGFGQSTPQNTLAPANFISQEADLYLPALIQAFGLNTYVLFGHSVGGSMSLISASRSTSNCVAVITEAAQVFVEELTLQGVNDAKTAFANPAQFSKLERWHGERAQWVLDSWTGAWLSPAFRSWTLEPYLENIRCPVLAIHGEKDEFGSCSFPERIIQGISSNGHLAMLPYGHVPHREDPQAVLNLVHEFLSDKP